MLTGRVFTCAISHTKDNIEITKDMVNSLLFNTKGTYHVYAIYHDRDNTKSNHWHFIIWAKTPRKVSCIANLLQTTENMVQIVHNKPLMLRYLCHLDNNDKERYEFNEVLTNSQDYAVAVKSNLITNKEIYDDIMKRGNDAIFEYIEYIEPNRLATIQRLTGNEYAKQIKRQNDEMLATIQRLVSNQNRVIEYLENTEQEYHSIIRVISERLPDLEGAINKAFGGIAASIRQLKER